MSVTSTASLFNYRAAAAILDPVRARCEPCTAGNRSIAAFACISADRVVSVATTTQFGVMLQSVVQKSDPWRDGHTLCRVLHRLVACVALFEVDVQCQNIPSPSTALQTQTAISHNLLRNTPPTKHAAVRASRDSSGIEQRVTDQKNRAFIAATRNLPRISGPS